MVTSPRVGAPLPVESQTNDVPVDLAAAVNALDAKQFIWLPPGLASARPVAGIAGRVYFATDWATAHPTAPLQLDTGSAWVDFTTRQQMQISWFVSGAFTASSRPAVWLAPAPCVLNYGYGILAGGNPSGSASAKWRLIVNGNSVATTLSGFLVLGSGSAKNQFSSPLVIAEGDRVQLEVANTTATTADLSVTVSGSWTAGNHT